jgi:pantoate--beta-alanine ligase
MIIKVRDEGLFQQSLFPVSKKTGTIGPYLTGPSGSKHETQEQQPAVMEIIRSVSKMQTRSEKVRLSGQTISLVPTMGFLHEGHLSLLRKARARGNDLVLSIFVNPAQFSPHEDLASYPKSLEKDLARAREEGVDAVFIPVDSDIYPAGYQTYVDLEKLPMHLCGLSRPSFFRGVATVVTQLFNIVKPHVAFFGEKDYQQLVIIRRMVKDLKLDIDITGCPIVRESDGLAMSSRNSYLTRDQRPAALSLYRSLVDAQKQVATGLRDAETIIARARGLIRSFPEIRIDYLSICDPESLEPVISIRKRALMAVAVNLAQTRLIDNIVLTAG